MAKRKFLKKLKEATPSGGGTYFAPDHSFKLKILKCVDKEDGQDGEFFIIEAKVLESTCPKQGKGYEGSQVINLERPSAPGNVAGFVKPALSKYAEDPDSGMDARDPENEEDWDDIEDLYYAICDEDENPLEGQIMYLRTKGILTKKNKTPFTIHTWTGDRPDSWGEDEEEDE